MVAMTVLGSCLQGVLLNSLGSQLENQRNLPLSYLWGESQGGVSRKLSQEHTVELTRDECYWVPTRRAQATGQDQDEREITLELEKNKTKKKPFPSIGLLQHPLLTNLASRGEIFTVHLHYNKAGYESMDLVLRSNKLITSIVSLPVW